VFEGTDCNSTLSSLGYADGNPFTTCSGTSPAGIELCGLTPGVTYFFWVGPYYSSTFGDIPVFAEAIIYPETGTTVPTDVCQDNASVDLFTAITGNVSTNGQWYMDAASSGNEVTSPISAVGANLGATAFFYVDAEACLADTVETEITVFGLPQVGTASPIGAGCNYGPVNLYDGLSGVVDLGGTWYDDASTDLGSGLITFDGEAAGAYNYHYVVDNGVCAADTSTVIVSVVDCAGLSDEDFTFEVYPNPVAGLLSIRNFVMESNLSISIVDLQGKTVISMPVLDDSGQIEIDMESLENGVYIVRLVSDSYIKETRVVKQ